MRAHHFNSLHFLLFQSLTLSPNPNTPLPWLSLSKDTHASSILLDPLDILIPHHVIQHWPRVPQLCSLSLLTHLPTNTLQQASSHQVQQSSKGSFRGHLWHKQCYINECFSLLIFLHLSPMYHSFRFETLFLGFPMQSLPDWILGLWTSSSISLVGSVSSAWVLSVSFLRLGHELYTLLVSYLPQHLATITTSRVSTADISDNFQIYFLIPDYFSDLRTYISNLLVDILSQMSQISSKSTMSN